MDNPFDQFDANASPQATQGMNPFDQFDTSGSDMGQGAARVQGFNSAVPFGERAVAGVGAAMASPFVDDSYSDLYNQARGNQKATHAANPDEYLTGSLVGTGVTLAPALYGKAIPALGIAATGKNSLPLIGDLADAANAAGTKVNNFVGNGSNLISRAARSSIVAAPTGALYGYGAGDEGSRADSALEGLGMGAVAGAAIPAAVSALKGSSNLIGEVGNRVGSLFGNEAAQGNIADNITAKIASAAGKTPNELKFIYSQGQDSGLDPSLGEATGLSGILQNEKTNLRTPGAGSDLLQKFFKNRNQVTVPNAINNFADQVAPQDGVVSGLYNAASTEANSTGSPAGLNAVTGIKQAINTRLGQLGNVSNVESSALNKASTIIDNAGQRGNNFDALLDAKKQLDNLYVENGDSAVQNQARGYVTNYSNQINNALKQMAPTAYPQALTAAKANMASQDLTDAVNDTSVGSLKALYNKVWATPELQADFLRKLPDDASRQQATNIFTHLEKIKNGFGGSDTAFNIPAGDNLQRQTGIGFDPKSLDVFQAPQALAESVGRKMSAGVYKKLAEQSINPNIDSIASRMQRMSGGAPAASNPLITGAGSQQISPSQPLQVTIPRNTANPYVPNNSIPAAPASALSPRTDAQQPQPQQQGQNDLFSRVIQTESAGNQNAVSPRGAIGVAQIMPGTAKEAAAAAGLPYDPFKLRTDANYNATLGKAYLGSLQGKYQGNNALALMAYNWGQGNVDMWLKSGAKLNRIPTETQNYLSRILG